MRLSFTSRLLRRCGVLGAVAAVALTSVAVAPALSSAPTQAVAPSPSAARANQGGTFGYSFRPAFFAKGGKFDANFLTRVDAMVGIPAGTGPRPVIYLMHGVHQECATMATDKGITPSAVGFRWEPVCRAVNPASKAPLKMVAWQRGLTYLSNALNEAGFVTVSLDMGAPRSNWLGESNLDGEQWRIVLNLHKRILRDIKAGKTFGLNMPANTRQVLGSKQWGLIGHSASGGYVMEETAFNTDPNYLGGMALEPFSDEAGFRATRKVRRPLAVYLGTCDEQIPFERGGNKLVRDFQKQHPRQPMTVLNVKGATHFGVNQSSRQAQILPSARERKGCGKPGAILRPREMQRGFAANAVAFFEQAKTGRWSFTLPRNSDSFPVARGYTHRLKIDLQRTRMPQVDISAPRMQKVDRQLARDWDPKKFPVTSGDG